LYLQIHRKKDPIKSSLPCKTQNILVYLSAFPIYESKQIKTGARNGEISMFESKF